MYEEDDDFNLTETDGIWFFLLYLHIKGPIDHVTCMYDSLEYLNRNKEEQKKLILLWCKTVGLTSVCITWPETEKQTIGVSFDPVDLI